MGLGNQFLLPWHLIPRRIKSDVKRMLKENNERIIRAITEQFSQSIMANREKGTISSQPETDPKGGTSSDSAPDTFRKVNAFITLRSRKEIHNHVGDKLNEKSDIPATTTTDDSGEFKEDEPTAIVTTLPPKTTSTPPIQVQKPIALFPDRLKGKKDQTHIDKIKETFSQVKINILLLDALPQMPPSARFLKELCTTKRAIGIPKRTFLASNVSPIIAIQIPVKYKDPG